MDVIKVEKTKLLDTVRTNMENHRAIFEKALEGYRKQVIAELESMLEEAKAGKRIRRSVNLIEPMDQTKDYKRIVTALEMSTDEIIELNEHEFAQYVMDDWNWKNQFATSTMTYLAQGV